MRDLTEMTLAAGFWLVAIWLFLAVSPSYGADCPPGHVPANTPTGCVTIKAGPGCYVEFGETECTEKQIGCLDETISDRELIEKYDGAVGAVCSFARDFEKGWDRAQSRAQRLRQRLRACRRRG